MTRDCQILGLSLQDFQKLPKKIVPKISWHDLWERFEKMSLLHQLIYFADFIRKTLLAWRTIMAPVLFLLPLPNCFFRVCLPTLFAAVLKLFLPLTTSAFFAAANSNMSAPTILQLGRYIYAKMNCCSPNNLCECTESPSTCRPIPLKNGISTCLEAAIL